ncbi:MAG: hypothetical protein VKL59_06685 [Nostocaceae cyanobacterium]|nr:hypothetical protein [Nostocaceae cyanobacterium]
MNSLAEFFVSSVRTAFGTDLGSVFVVYYSEVFASLPTNPLQQVSELTKSSIEHMLAQKAFGTDTKVNILDKYSRLQVYEVQ